MTVETQQDITGLTRVADVVREALASMKAAVQPGVTTGQLDTIATAVLERHGAQSAPVLVYGFPGTTCISVNDAAVHGIPGDRRVRLGDLIKLDVTAELDGYIADSAITVAVPPVTLEAQQLCDCAEAALREALSVAKAGEPINVIGRAVESVVLPRGFTILRDLSGHGVGRNIHEQPTVPNFFDPHIDTVLT